MICMIFKRIKFSPKSVSIFKYLKSIRILSRFFFFHKTEAYIIYSSKINNNKTWEIIKIITIIEYV